MRPSDEEVVAAARTFFKAGSHHEWWPRHLTYDALDPIGLDEFNAIVERALLAAAAARAEQNTG